MDNCLNNGILLSLDECKTLFPLLKGMENTLPATEREILLKIEKVLYAHLSIRDVENLVSSPPE
ncbi:MAG: hypothetical protein LBP42_06180 [Treponema sp.]|jgi:hypothetical protein|nr:hypothetical protein [Treponema sp.]